MDSLLTCARCGVRLRQPQGLSADAASFACPRCRAEVPKPGGAMPGSLVTTSAEPNPPTSVLEAGTKGCPFCSGPMMPGVSICPKCAPRPPTEDPTDSLYCLQRDIRSRLIPLWLVILGLVLLGGCSLAEAFPTVAGGGYWRSWHPRDTTCILTPFLLVLACAAFMDLELRRLLIRSTVGRLVFIATLTVVLGLMILPWIIDLIL
jgi:hypothetical protein